MILAAAAAARILPKHSLGGGVRWPAELDDRYGHRFGSSGTSQTPETAVVEKPEEEEDDGHGHHHGHAHEFVLAWAGSGGGWNGLLWPAQNA